MKCYDCGGSLANCTGSLDLPSVALGSFTLTNVAYLKCYQCGEVILPDDTWEMADQKENDLINDFLMNLPVKDYIGASAVASILNISRQGLHKHRRIRRGFIYSIVHEGKRLYNKKSVEMYKETNDGRFLLSGTISQDKTEYVLVPVITDIKGVSYTKEDTISPFSYEQDSELAIASNCH